MDYLDELRTARRYVEFACAMCGCETLARRIDISFNSRFTSRMGDASTKYMRIRVSKPLWPIASPVQRRAIVIHEACHIIADRTFGRRCGHGSRWKKVMRMCGERPLRCHDVDTSSLKRRRARYKVVGCSCGHVDSVSFVKASRIRKGVSEYICKKCDNKLQLTGEKV